MNEWKELSLTKKILIVIAVLIVGSIAPELFMVVDIAGIDVAILCLIIYFKPVIEWIKCKKAEVIEELRIVKEVILNSALARPKVFTLNTIYCSLFMFMTGSLIFSLSLFLPALFVSGVYV